MTEQRKEGPNTDVGTGPMGQPVIVSGGQTGVDRAALDAALAIGWPCGGWCPQGRLAEDGVIPDQYPLTELKRGGYAARTRRNVEDSDGTLVIYFGRPSGGTALTEKYCRQTQRPLLSVNGNHTPPREAARAIARFVRTHNITRLNVAGPRASGEPKAYDYTRKALGSYLEGLEKGVSRTKQPT